jgi:hypothetical protein
MAVDPIIADLQYVMETSQELDILNFHKSFPITCKARVETIERDVVVLKVDPPGSVCLEAQDQTIVLSRGLPEAVRAQIASFDLVNGVLKLNDFSYVGSHFGDRMIARVQPDDTLGVEIEVGEEKYSGTLVDVSLSGVGVTVQQLELQRGQLLQLTLSLPEGKVSLPGKILNSTEVSDGTSRLSIGFTRNAQEIAVIMRYIKDRRIEILSEIEHMYERSYRTKLSQSKDKQE